jgi:Asp-tRNA(Asn)/Glu-tRNA(Gln) amidotransferase A subunit family amidase
VRFGDHRDTPKVYRANGSVTFTSNVSGVPAASVFCGLADDGLPIRLQIAGKPFSDCLVLSACYAFERVYGRAPRPSDDQNSSSTTSTRKGWYVSAT